MSKILDVIILIHDNYKQFFLILDKMPVFKYERIGNYCLLARSDGFYSVYEYEEPSENCRAFAGHKFDIHLLDGTIIKAYGQWWAGDVQKRAPEPIKQVGINTIEGLRKCYVFMSGHISQKKLEEWLAHNEPSNDYRKYDKIFTSQRAGWQVDEVRRRELVE